MRRKPRILKVKFVAMFKERVVPLEMGPMLGAAFVGVVPSMVYHICAPTV